MITLKKIKEIGTGKIKSIDDPLEAVKENGYALSYVSEQTPEICLEAVKQNGYALKYVSEQTPEICLEAVKKYGDVLKYVNDQTPEMCLEAVKQNEDALQYVNPKIFKHIIEIDGKQIELSEESFNNLKSSLIK